MAARVLVGFAGSRAGTAPLSWGQTAIWRAIQHLVPDDGAMNMSWITALEEEGVSHDTPLERITSTVALVMGRHESLCTRFPLDPSGEPQQVLADAGTVPVEIVDAGDTPPAQAAAALRDRLANPAFDYGTEWPWRIGVVRTGDVVTHAGFALCHLATDRGGVNALVRDVLHALAGNGLPPAPEPPALQPLDQARHQQSPAGLRQSNKALRYWARLLRDVPLDRFPGPRHPARAPRYWNAVLNSPAMDRAVGAVAARHQVTTSAVLLAAAAFELTRQTGGGTCVLQLIVGNRFRPGLTESVSPTAQDGLCVIEVGDADFDTVVDRAAKASMQAYLHAQYDPAGLDRALAEAGVDLSCSFNDRRFDLQTPVGVAGPADVPATTFFWRPPLERYGARYFLHINGVPDAIELELFADTEVLPPEAMEAYLRGMEELVVAAGQSTTSSAV